MSGGCVARMSHHTTPHTTCILLIHTTSIIPTYRSLCYCLCHQLPVSPRHHHKENLTPHSPHSVLYLLVSPLTHHNYSAYKSVGHLFRVELWSVRHKSSWNTSKTQIVVNFDCFNVWYCCKSHVRMSRHNIGDNKLGS